eukprot:m.220713 g.220713  ORF g.220713 m.220713 type:complete len:450 (+) comp19167_c2_seq21:107-1456(+)
MGLYSDTVNGGSADDILRDVDGTPIDARWIAEKLGVENPDSIEILEDVKAVPTSLIGRGPHSFVARITLHIRTNTVGADETPTFPRALFIKRCVVQDLLEAFARPSVKIPRDVNSYNNETVFYHTFCPILREKAGVDVAKTYHCHVEHNKDSPELSRFLILVESLDNYEQVRCQDVGRLRGSLAQLARMHAFFWNNVDYLPSVRDKLWSRGGFWDVEKTTIPGDLSKIKERYDTFLERFRGTHAVFSEPGVETLGDELQHNVAWLDGQVARIMHSGRTTVVHGDYKNANIFFRKDFQAPSGGEPVRPDADLGMCMIDYQWTGPGVAMQDVIYLLTTSAPYEGCLGVQGCEEELLRFYHVSLCEHLKARGEPAPTYGVLLDDLDIVALDYFRMLFSYMLKSATLQTLIDNKEKFNRGQYIRNLDNLAWMVRKALTCVRNVKSKYTDWKSS